MQIDVRRVPDLSRVLTIFIEFRVLPSHCRYASEIVLLENSCFVVARQSGQVIERATCFVVVQFHRSLSLRFEFELFGFILLLVELSLIRWEW